MKLLQLVYTEVAFVDNFEGGVQSRKPPAPATVYERIDIDVKPGAARLPQRGLGGYRDDDSDYEDIHTGTGRACAET